MSLLTLTNINSTLLTWYLILLQSLCLRLLFCSFRLAYDNLKILWNIIFSAFAFANTLTVMSASVDIQIKVAYNVTLLFLIYDSLRRSNCTDNEFLVVKSSMQHFVHDLTRSLALSRASFYPRTTRPRSRLSCSEQIYCSFKLCCSQPPPPLHYHFKSIETFLINLRRGECVSFALLCAFQTFYLTQCLCTNRFATFHIVFIYSTNFSRCVICSALDAHKWVSA